MTNRTDCAEKKKQVKAPTEGSKVKGIGERKKGTKANDITIFLRKPSPQHVVEELWRKSSIGEREKGNEFKRIQGRDNLQLYISA